MQIGEERKSLGRLIERTSPAYRLTFGIRLFRLGRLKINSRLAIIIVSQETCRFRKNRG